MGLVWRVGGEVRGGVGGGGGKGYYYYYWAPLTCQRHIPPHPAQPQHTDHWAPPTRKRHQQEHRPQQPTERSDPTQHAKGRTGDCPGPRKGATTRRTVTQGGGDGGAEVRERVRGGAAASCMPSKPLISAPTPHALCQCKCPDWGRFTAFHGLSDGRGGRRVLFCRRHPKRRTFRSSAVQGQERPTGRLSGSFGGSSVPSAAPRPAFSFSGWTSGNCRSFFVSIFGRLAETLLGTGGVA